MAYNVTVIDTEENTTTIEVERMNISSIKLKKKALMPHTLVEQVPVLPVQQKLKKEL